MLLSGKKKQKSHMNDGKSQIEKSSDINLPTTPALDIKDVSEMPAKKSSFLPKSGQSWINLVDPI